MVKDRLQGRRRRLLSESKMFLDFGGTGFYNMQALILAYMRPFQCP